MVGRAEGRDIVSRTEPKISARRHALPPMMAVLKLWGANEATAALLTEGAELRLHRLGFSARDFARSLRVRRFHVLFVAVGRLSLVLQCWRSCSSVFRSPRRAILVVGFAQFQALFLACTNDNATVLTFCRLCSLAVDDLAATQATTYAGARSDL